MKSNDPHTRVILPPAPIGVIGGGQLGRMFLMAAQRMGYDAGVLSETEDGPGAQVANWAVVSPPDHLPGIRQFAEKAEAVTIEFENVSAPALRWIERKRPTRPGWRTVWVSQNRLREKRFLAENGFPLAPWRPVLREEDLAPALRDLGAPIVLKTAASGYDGKGQAKVDNEADARDAFRRFGSPPCVAEGWVEFAHEVSVVSVRGADGSAAAFPVGLNRHANHILDSTLLPAPVGPIVSAEARETALGISQALGTIGVLTVEFFLTADGRLLVNELAPRPHNSGHATIEAAEASQYEQQVRAMCGLPLGRTDLARPAAMVNLLGDFWAGGEPDWEAMFRADPGVKLHLYGKRAAVPGRKMGHLTVLDPDPDQALGRAIEARRRLRRTT